MTCPAECESTTVRLDNLMRVELIMPSCGLKLIHICKQVTRCIVLTLTVPFPIERIHCWMDFRLLSNKEKLLTREVKFEVMLLAVVVVVFPVRMSACQCWDIISSISIVTLMALAQCCCIRAYNAWAPTSFQCMYGSIEHGNVGIDAVQ